MARSTDTLSRWPVLGKIGLSTVLCTKVGITLLTVRRPLSPISKESKTKGFRRTLSSAFALTPDRSPGEMLPQPSSLKMQVGSRNASFRSVI